MWNVTLTVMLELGIKLDEDVESIVLLTVVAAVVVVTGAFVVVSATVVVTGAFVVVAAAVTPAARGDTGALRAEANDTPYSFVAKTL